MKTYNKEQGASLFVALIMLLILTTLAVSSMRGVVLEGRITANRTEQLRLDNQSDSATRAAGNLIAGKPTVLMLCADQEPQPCLKGNTLPTDYSVTDAWFSDYDGSGVGGTKPAKGLYSGWYLNTAPAGEAEGQTNNPEYGNRMRGIGTFYYEANAYAQSEKDSENIVYTRAVFSKTYN